MDVSRRGGCSSARRLAAFDTGRSDTDCADCTGTYRTEYFMTVLVVKVTSSTAERVLSFNERPEVHTRSYPADVPTIAPCINSSLYHVPGLFFRRRGLRGVGALAELRVVVDHRCELVNQMFEFRRLNFTILIQVCRSLVRLDCFH